MKIDKNLSEIFDIEDTTSTSTDIIDINDDVIPVSNVNDLKQIDDDFKKSRENLYTLIEQGKRALESSLELAVGSENPKAYDAFSKVMAELTKLNAELLENHTRKQKLTTKPADGDSPSSVTNNALFVGTTSDLKKFLKDMQK